MKIKHPDITKEQTKIYINKHLKEPQQIVQLSINCPVPGCKYTAHTKRKSSLKNNLFIHILETQKHQSQRKNHSRKSLAKYLEQNYTSKFVPDPNYPNFLENDEYSPDFDQKYPSFFYDECGTVDDQKPIILEQLFSHQSPRKTRRVSKDNVPDNAFTISCIHCSPEQKFYSIHKDYLIDNFKKQHMKIKHPDITKEQTKIYINKHLKEPKQIVQLSINCPVPGCKYTARAKRKSSLKSILFNHILETQKHQSQRKNHSRKSLAKYLEQNYTSKFVPDPKLMELKPFFSSSQFLF